MRKHVDGGSTGPGGSAPTPRGSHQRGTSGHLPRTGARGAAPAGGAERRRRVHICYHQAPSKEKEAIHSGWVHSRADAPGWDVFQAEWVPPFMLPGGALRQRANQAGAGLAMKGESLREAPAISRRTCGSASPGAPRSREVVPGLSGTRMRTAFTKHLTHQLPPGAFRA